MSGQWILTDPDAAQFVRSCESPSVWECIQVVGNDQVGYSISHAWIDLVNDYSSEEIDAIMQMYYGQEWKEELADLNQEHRQRIIAECVFETEYGMPVEPKYKTFDKAAEAVRLKIGVSPEEEKHE